MKILAALPLIAAMAMSAPANSAEVVVYKSKTQGGYASASWWDTNRSSYIWLSEGTLNDAEYVQLYYYIYDYSSPSLQWTFWSGQLPKTSLAGNFQGGNLQLTIDTCTIAPTSGCGAIDITWKRNDYYRSSNSGVTRSDFNSPYSQYSYSYQVQGSSDYSSATVEGTLLGVPMPASNANGNIGANHSITHNITKIQ